MMCFVAVYHGNHLVMQGMREDDGNSTYKYAKEKGIRLENGKCTD